MGLEVLKLALGFLAVGGLMWFAWRKASKLPGFGGQGHLSIVERHTLTRNSVLVVVRDGDEKVVLAAGDHTVTEISRTPWVEPATPPAPELGQKFGSILDSVRSKKSGGTSTPPAS